MKKNTVLFGLIISISFQNLSSATSSSVLLGKFKKMRVTAPQEASQEIPECPNKKFIEMIKNGDEARFYPAFTMIQDIDFLFEERGYFATPLMWSIFYGSHFLEDLVFFGVDVNKPGSNGDTPLIWAVQKGDFDAVTTLLNAKAEINYCKADGRSALDYAFEAGHKDAVCLLVGRGADVAKLANFFMYLVSEGDAERVKKILDAGATAFINYRRADGKSALDYALEASDNDMVTLLLEYGADITSTNSHGEDAIAVAQVYGYPWIERMRWIASGRKDLLTVAV